MQLHSYSSTYEKNQGTKSLLFVKRCDITKYFFKPRDEIKTNGEHWTSGEHSIKYQYTLDLRTGTWFFSLYAALQHYTLAKR